MAESKSIDQWQELVKSCNESDKSNELIDSANERDSKEKCFIKTINNNRNCASVPLIGDE